jgi:hypothetical protein
VLLPDHGYVVADDCRFGNEAEAVRGQGGVVFEVQRPGFDAAEHASEAGIPGDHVIRNVGSLADLQTAAHAWADVAMGDGA